MNPNIATKRSEWPKIRNNMARHNLIRRQLVVNYRTRVRTWDRLGIQYIACRTAIARKKEVEEIGSQSLHLSVGGSVYRYIGQQADVDRISRIIYSRRKHSPGLGSWKWTAIAKQIRSGCLARRNTVLYWQSAWAPFSNLIGQTIRVLPLTE